MNKLDLAAIKRINVVGTSGCGKSTFSKKLSEVLNIPYVEMDRVYWKPNWVEPADEEFFSKLQEAINGEQWILDGNYGRTTAIKWRDVELVIWLDYSFATIFYRALKRVIYRSVTQEELWSGNRETFRMAFFSRDSILLWVLKTYRSNKRKYCTMMTDGTYPHIHFMRLASPTQAQRFLDKCTLLKSSHTSL